MLILTPDATSIPLDIYCMTWKYSKIKNICKRNITNNTRKIKKKIFY